MLFLRTSLVILLAGCGASAAEPLYWLRTIAGNDEVGDGGPAVGAAFLQPEGLLVDNRGRVFIADAADHRVRVVLPDGRIRTYAGDGHPGYRGDGGPAEKAQLRYPYGLALDAHGNLYIADLGNANIRRVSPEGIIYTVGGGSSAGPRWIAPRNVAVDASGGLYVADFGGHRIYRRDRSGSWTVVAGTGAPGWLGDRGPAVAAQLHAPAGLAVDAAGTLYFADTGNRRIRYIKNGAIDTLGVAGMPAWVFPIPLYAPTGVCLDAAGTLYISDGEQALRMAPLGHPQQIPGGAHEMAVDAAGTIYAIRGRAVYRQSGQTTSVFAGGGTYGFRGDGLTARETRFRSPATIASAPNGVLYVGDSGNGLLRRVDALGNVSTVLAGLQDLTALAVDRNGDVLYTETATHALWRWRPGTAQPFLVLAGLDHPSGVATDAAGNVYVSETDASRIRKLSAGGTVSVLSGFNRPQGLALDQDGNLYVADAGMNAIRRVSSDGAVETVMDGLNGPCGVAVDGAGVVYAADTGFHRIRCRVPGRPAETVAGTGEEGFNGDEGAADSVQLSYPTALAWDSAGNLLIADTGNHRIRRLELSISSPAATVRKVRVLHAATLAEGPFAAGQLVRIEGLGADTAVSFDELSAHTVYRNGALFAQIPSEFAFRTKTTFLAEGSAVVLELQSAAPGIFPTGGPARAGEPLTLTVTGQGGRHLPVAVSIGGRPADLLGEAPHPELPGVSLLTVRVPPECEPGYAPAQMWVGSVVSPAVTLKIETTP